MAFLRKNSEFRPDSSIRNWTQRLYLSPQQQKRYLKWILLAVLSVLSLLLQDVLFSRISIYGSTVDLVPCALIVICVMQGIESGCGTDAPGSYIAWLCKQTTVHSMVMPGKRYDIGDLASYERVKSEYLGIGN